MLPSFQSYAMSPVLIEKGPAAHPALRSALGVVLADLDVRLGPPG